MRAIGASYAWVFGNIRVDPTDENTVYTLALGMSVSRDGGKTFGRLGAPWPGAPPADAHGRTAAPAATTTGCGSIRRTRTCLVLGNDSGFRVSTDGGQTWRRADLPVQTVFSMNYDMDTPFRVYASVQDHGSYRAADRYQRRPRELESRCRGRARLAANTPSTPSIRGTRTSCIPAS